MGATTTSVEHVVNCKGKISIDFQKKNQNKKDLPAWCVGVRSLSIETKSATLALVPFLINFK